MHFYERTAAGVYVDLSPTTDGIVSSKELPGFQFRVSDLYDRPALEDLAMDEIYQGYVLLEYQATMRRAEEERLRAEEERLRADKAEENAKQYRDMLRKLGIPVDEN